MMSVIKRIYTSLVAGVDQLIGEIENHDALIQAALKERRKKIAVAKVQLARIRSSKERVQEQIKQLQDEERRWTTRAASEAPSDESKALLCLEQRQTVRSQIEKLLRTQTEYSGAADKMAIDIKRCDDELGLMSQKYELMRARQSSSDAINVINQVGSAQLEEIELSFDRWEVKVAQNEFQTVSTETIDPFEKAYIEKENEEQLRAELAELLGKKDSKESTHENQ